MAETTTRLGRFLAEGARQLAEVDPDLAGAVEEEYLRQTETLALVASCSPTDPSVLACEGSFTSNVTAEGYPSARYHAGCVNVDRFEQLAIDRAKAAFKATYANVQPHTASTANQVVMASLLKPGDKLMGMDLDAGGHLSHGARVNLSGKLYDACAYGLKDDGTLDYEQARAMALERQPRLIICGTTAYPRAIDWERFRAIADEVGAWLLADITHIAGLVVTGRHPSPVDVAHVTTTCTHKQLYGPRGGLILLGREADADGPGGVSLSKLMQRGIFPLVQGAPIINNIVAKARTLGRAVTPAFDALCERIVVCSGALSEALVARGARVMSGGSDNHIVVVDVLTSFGLTGVCAEEALEACGVVVNRNRIAGDTKPPRVASGVRLGTNSMAARGMGAAPAAACADLIADICDAVEMTSDTAWTLADGPKQGFMDRARGLCRAHPIAGYPVADAS